MRGSRRPYSHRGGARFSGPPPPAGAIRGKKPEVASSAAAAAAGGGGAAKATDEKKAGSNGTAANNEIEEGQIEDEKPLNDILKGRHAIVFCNEQSKYKRMAIDWEQVSETGPPHDKTFTWSLKMGSDLVTIGVANSKKLAKQKAAEDMARKLDALGPTYGGGGGSFAAHRKRPSAYSNPAPQNTQFQLVQQSLKKARKSAEPRASNEHAPLDKKSQNNPISKLYEHCRQKHWPEPTFETISENVLDTYKTQQGFTLKKTEFTIQCALQGKKFVGSAMTKKEAKHNAAAAAWAEFGVGVPQDSISNMLQAQRDGGAAAAKK